MQSIVNALEDLLAARGFRPVRYDDFMREFAREDGARAHILFNPRNGAHHVEIFEPLP